MTAKSNKVHVLDQGFVELLDFMGDDEAIVRSAKVSFQAQDSNLSDEQIASFLDMLISKQHTSPFEQVVFKFHMKLPIFVARQIVRHRTASLNEASARYSQLAPEFYIPSERAFNLRTKASSNISYTDFVKQISEANTLAYTTYVDLFNSGVAKELARIVLPVNIFTEWYWTMDLHNLMKFLVLRADSHAQYETQLYAKAIFTLIEQIVPLTMKAFEKKHNLTALKGDKANG
jgi:thymidylate synthase (FAD)